MARIAFVVGDDFEECEFCKPYDAFVVAGHDVDILGVEVGKRHTGKHGKETVTIEKAVTEVDVADYDALVIPGGYSPDHLRTNPAIVAFVNAMVRADKLVAAVCHGPQLLIEADAVRGRTLTSWPSVRTDLVNAGATWVDRPVAVDGKLITSRKPDDVPAFTLEIGRMLSA